MRASSAASPGSPARVNSDGTTLTGNLTYQQDLGNGLSFSPGFGFGTTRMDASNITYKDGSTLNVGAHTNSILFLTAGLEKTTPNADGDALFGKFVTATIYRDTSARVNSTYTPLAGTPQTIQTQNLGTYGEISVGIDYVKVLQPGAFAGAKQLSASLRADARFSGNVKALGLTAQLRWQF